MFYVPPPPPSTHGEGHYPYQSPPFYGSWENPIGAGVKKKVQRQRNSSGKKQPLKFNSNTRTNFMIKLLSNFDLMNWIDKLKIKHFRGIYSRDGLPRKIGKECGIINVDDIKGAGTHWVCYRNLDSMVEYFDPFGLIVPNEALRYFRTSGKQIVYSIDEIQNRNTLLCGYWCLYYLLERQMGSDILDVIHNSHFDNGNSDFIKAYFSGGPRFPQTPLLATLFILRNEKGYYSIRE